MNKKVKNSFKLIVTVVIIGLFVWFLILSPFLTFKNYEKAMTDAAKRFFQANTYELPTGTRIKTVTLQDLYNKAYVKEDFYIPYTKKPCSITESWVKVKKVNGEYKYYTYLQCGALASTIDHKGPTITLEGKDKITISKNEEFKDPGVKSVVDNNDGKMDLKSVTIKGKVDTSKVGTYELTYSAFDSLSNKTEVKREVEVVEVLKSTVKEATKDKGYYTGANPNNYIYFSNMLFRIIGIDGDNVKIVSDIDIANVNYDGVDKWLNDYFYKHLSKESKKLIVENKYCNMDLTDETLGVTECNSYTGKRKMYIPSIVDVNKANDSSGNFMYPKTISWISSAKNNKEMYTTRLFFYNEVPLSNLYFEHYMAFDKKLNFGVRPVITIKGSTLLKDGNGTRENPYSLGDTKKGKAKEKLNNRNTGEYVKLSGVTWRIIETESDGTTKVISEENVYDGIQQITYRYSVLTKEVVYNPKQKNNVGYYINNRMSEYVDTKYFVNKKIKVPIYKKDAMYGKESEFREYKVRFLAPNMYEMFSASTGYDSLKSYWLINSSKDSTIKYGVSDIGVVMYGEEANTFDFGVRLVGYIDSDYTIVTGNGTYGKPYTISK